MTATLQTQLSQTWSSPAAGQTVFCREEQDENSPTGGKVLNIDWEFTQSLDRLSDKDRRGTASTRLHSQAAAAGLVKRVMAADGTLAPTSDALGKSEVCLRRRGIFADIRSVSSYSLGSGSCAGEIWGLGRY